MHIPSNSKCKFRSYIIQGYVKTFACKTKCYVNINAYCMTCQFETVSKSYVIGQVSEFKLEYKKLQFYILRDKLCLYIYFSLLGWTYPLLRVCCVGGGRGSRFRCREVYGLASVVYLPSSRSHASAKPVQFLQQRCSQRYVMANI